MINGILVFGAQKRNKNAILVWMILAIFQAIIFAIFSIIGFIDLAETVDRKSRNDINAAITDKNNIHLAKITQKCPHGAVRHAKTGEPKKFDILIL